LETISFVILTETLKAQQKYARKVAMKMFFPIMAIIFCIFFRAQISWAKSGNGWVSSGGDNIPSYYGASWFNHSAGKINYCLGLDKNYSYSKNQLREMIDRSILSWRKYYLEKTKIGNRYAINDNTPNFNFIFESECSKRTKVIFYFNIQNKLTLANKARFQNPYSFAAFNYDQKIGYFWFSDLAEKMKDQMISKNALEVLIMHELGHAFGVPHVESTIMKEGIVKSLTNPFLTTDIDLQGKVIFSTRENFEISGKIPLNFGVGNTPESLFERFTGKKPIGTIKARLINSHLKQFDEKSAFQLFFSDDSGEFKINLNSNKIATTHNFNTRVFMTYVENQSSMSQLINYQNSSTWILAGEIVDSAGKQYQMIIDINNTTSGSAPFTVRIIEHSSNKLLTIFSNGN